MRSKYAEESSLVIRSVGIAAIVAAMGLPGCERDDRVIREWRPDDHAEPGGGEPSGQAAPEEAAAPGGGDTARTSEEQEARAVSALFGVSCASCHGALGEGNGPSRPSGAQMVSFADARWQSARTDAQIAEVITAGRGLMPAFGTQVNPRGIAALVRHIRALGGGATAVPAPAQDVAPSAIPAPLGVPAAPSAPNPEIAPSAAPVPHGVRAAPSTATP